MKSITVIDPSPEMSFIPVVKSAIFSLIVSFALFFIFALVLYLTDVSDGIISQTVFGICMISLILGGMIASKSASKSGFLHGALVALCYFFVVFIGSAFVNKGITFNMRMFTLLLGCLASGMFGGIVGINIKPKKRRW